MEVFYSIYNISNVKNEYKNLGINADACNECKKCENICPYGVPIVKNIKKLHKLCEP
jgi:NAD-dependent dihydropyrimidine dehydrogenase PreA subunit